MAEAVLAVQPYPSLAALRTAETNLLTQLEEVDESKPPAEFLAAVELFRQRGAATGRLISVPEERAEAQSILNFWLTVLYRAQNKPGAVVLMPFDHDAARARTADAIPYRGLEPFQIEDSARFFGRRRALTALLDKLRTGRLVAVTGLSGSGKSSVVRAGLIPALRDGAVPGSERWRYPAPIVPGKSPLGALKLRPEAPAETEFLEDSQTLATLLDGEGCPVCLVVDQFEELFTLAEDQGERRAFIANLVQAAAGGAYRHTVVLTMRSEFDDYVERYEQLAPLFAVGRVNLGALTAADLRLAIEQPAAQLGVRFEAGLIEELVQRVLGEPAGLPLLQFTLRTLWKRRKDGDLTWEAYRALGGSPREILARQATTVYESFELQQDRDLTRRVFQSLVQLGSGLEATARRVRRAELDRCGARDNVDRVLGIWRDAELVRVSPPGPITPDTQIEVAHEALIRNWPSLVQWIEEDFAASRRRRLLQQRALDWREGKEALLPELSLHEAESYYDLEDVEREYVTASRAAIDRANREIRRSRNWQIGIGVAASAIGLALTAYGYIQSQRAERLDKQRLAVEGQLAEARTKLSTVNEDTLREIGRLNELKAQIGELRKQKVELQAQKVEASARATKLESSLEKEKELSETVKAVLLAERPVIPVVDGKLREIPPSWASLKAVQEQVEATARSVGRLETASQSRSPYLGTAFVVAPGIIATHVFVAAEVKDVTQLRIDFADRPSASTGKFRVTELLTVVASLMAGVRQWELIFLRVVGQSDRGQPLPPPVRLEIAELEKLPVGIPLAVIGYPSEDNRMGQELSRALLGESSGVKRVQPGFLLDWKGSRTAAEIRYDCTTFGGNGGSPVINLRTGRIVGVHWGGTAQMGKFATVLTKSLVGEASGKLGVDLAK